MVAHKPIFLRLSIILTFVYWSAAMAQETQLIKLPGEVSAIPSPDGKYVLINVDSENEKQSLSLGGNHALYLQNLKTGKQKKIYSYDRYIEILWSPKGSKLLINDHGGSDYSFPIIFLINDNKQPIDVGKQIKENMAMASNQSISGNHHVYIVGTKWLDENRVKIKIYGYGDVDPRGFTLWYEYSIQNGFKSIR